MKDNKYFKDFGKPFPASDVSWRLQYVDKSKCEGFAVPYLDARAISDRLDSVVGQFGWKDSYEKWHSYTEKGRDKDKEIQSQLCTIYIYDEELKEWIGKNDGAENTDVESVKGGLSDAFKRAAVKWNIGRYLYGFEPVWVKAKQRGNAYVILESENPKLEKAYNDTIVKMFGANGNTNPQSAPQTNQTTAPAPSTSSVAQPQSNNTEKTNEVIYEVKNIKVEAIENGFRSSLILAGGGKQYKAFMNGKDEKLRTGTKITNLKAETKKNSYGSYAILNSYQIAA